MVEFALVLPLVVLLIVGIFKFGVLFNHYLTLTDAVRSGARQLAVERGQGGVDVSVPCSDAVARVKSTAGSLDLSQLAITVKANASAPSSTYVSPPDAGTCATMVSGEAAVVSATYPCEATIIGINFVPGCTLKASATERTE